MKAIGAVRLALLLQRSMRPHAVHSPHRYNLEEPPLRSELFNADQMEHHGKHLATIHQVAMGRSKRSLLARLAENERVLLEVCNLLTTAVAADHRVTPAGEWLLDNFYLIEEQIRIAKRHLPQRYSRELPYLLEGPSAGLPRVYDIALETISHGDGQLGPGRLNRLVAAYQKVDVLTLGELWAIPIMLRLALIENLRRVSTQIAADRLDRNRAGYWADHMIDIANRDPKSLILLTADMARSRPPMTAGFVSEMARRLQGQSPALALPLTWIEQWLAEAGLTIEQLVHAGNQQQAADQVSISNSIGSLRALGAINWKDFVESLSVVEHSLRQDPEGSYPRMDFTSRDRYRHVVEALAKTSLVSEAQVARAAIKLAADAAMLEPKGRRAHVGYFLIDSGKDDLEKLIQRRYPGLEVLRRLGKRHAASLYLGGIVVLTAIASTVIMRGALLVSLDYASIFGLFVLVVIASSQLAVELVNWLVTQFTRPNLLPRLDYSQGIPAHARTIVVVPTFLLSPKNIDDLIEALEVRFLANRDQNLFFGLLTDFRDADLEHVPGDDVLLQHACLRIQDLNRKYHEQPVFFLFHRPRRWNVAENLWMGYERKRGKLADLNALLRTGSTSGFSRIEGDVASLRDIKYVITLDTDTHLPRDSARQFVGTMAHPLNRAEYVENRKRVCQGYGILQPRVSTSLSGINRSAYARLFGGEPGIDPYTRAVSDVYQDLFLEGSFIGKGIYDIEAFESTLQGQLPENLILSHDLLEGCYARAGLLSDVQLYEEYPSSYQADMLRRHRWIRGDWQVLSWLFSSVPGPVQSERHRNPLTFLSRWKLFDNLRRSLVPGALTSLLLLDWLLWPSHGFLTCTVLIIFLSPAIVVSSWELLQKPEEAVLKAHILASLHSATRRFAQAGFGLACLPYEAFLSLDAITRAVWRMRVSGQRLLEWNPSGQSSDKLRTDLIGSYKSMWAGPALAGVSVLYLALMSPIALLVAGPVLLLWLVAPALASALSQPRSRRATVLTAGQLQFLRKLARRTWAFFETFVGPADHWLPPDNYQEYRDKLIAHRTSPTNMGLSLLANLCAYDFGYLSVGKLIERSTHSLQTMQSLERYRGHFYNWYDSQSLRPLRPSYISSVDSGNLAGHLLTLRAGFLNLPDTSILPSRWLEGIYDTFDVLIESLGDSAQTDTFVRFQRHLDAARASWPQTLSTTLQSAQRLLAGARELIAQVALNKTLTPSDNLSTRNMRRRYSETNGQEWVDRLARQCQVIHDELLFLAPWLLLLPTFGGRTDLAALDKIPTLRELAGMNKAWQQTIEHRKVAATPLERERLAELSLHVQQASKRAQERIFAINELARQAGEMAYMEYDLLYDKARHLLAIGYNVDERRRDNSYYDLLASEARLACFVAIAQRQLPQESWFALGRTLTAVGGDPVLFSWSGSMFEYLMPLLVMPSYENTLLDQTCKAAVARQIEYGKERNVPWGISESGYNAVDAHFNYQYRAFGVPGLGLKRGLSEDLVVAPYASVMALMVAPEDACKNLYDLAAGGVLSEFGFYEAIDYTPARQRRGQSSTLVRSYMAHHQGMSLLALGHLLLDRPMQRRFESDPQLQATLLLLHEGIPKVTVYTMPATELPDIRIPTETPQTSVRVFNTPDTAAPEVQLLSNGRYHVMVTNAGGGYSRWKDLAVTRWREDPTRDNWGTFVYLHDLASGATWSNAHQPSLQPAKHYEAIFSEGRAEFRRRDQDYDTHTEIVVSPEDDIELRRLRIVNRARVRRTLEITTYAEVVLASSASDSLHPAFSNLFVQTEIVEERQAILCTRRPRSQSDRTPWMMHLLAVHGVRLDELSYETDRMAFIGRGNDVSQPQALRAAGPLSGSQGSVLDPIVAIRCRVTLDPEQAVVLDLVTGIGDTREAVLSLANKYHDRRLADRVFELASTHAHVVLSQINASEADAQLYERLAGAVLYANPGLRANASVLVQNRRGQSGLWGYAISGDLPIVLLRISDPAHIELVRQLVQAHAYWRLKGLAVDLIIWNEDHAGYRQLLHEHIMGLVAAGVEANVIDRPGGIFVRPGEQISNEDRVLLQTVARAIVTDDLGTLAEQIMRRGSAEPQIPRIKPAQVYRAVTQPALVVPEMILANGLGGFSPDGHEYLITTSPAQITPLPWVNVIANDQFGTVISESGMAYTWAENAHEFRLTPWHNDPVSDTQGEVLYMRDEENGHFWSPTALPCGGVTPYITRHGFGYSVFEHIEDGIRSELWVYVDLEAAIKFQVLKLRNESGRARRLTVSAYVEWVLGDLQSKSAMHVTTEIDTHSGALLARNPYNNEFAERVAFLDIDNSTRTVSGDRTEFLGRNGSIKNPAAMGRVRLSGRVGAGFDPCGAMQVQIDLAKSQEREIRVILGVGRGVDDARQLVHRSRGTTAAREALEKVRRYWTQTLGSVQVQTPDMALNVLANGWLVYQTLACRLWARSGFYQSGGAFGFRDQLQDTMALIYAEPQRVRQQILLSASRQFVEGDVQHWWHPPSGRGVRTHCSDDYLWLPLATCRYVRITGDRAILNEPVYFLEGRPVNPEEDSYYDLPNRSSVQASLYEHCVRACRHGLRFGSHGLPLIGSGDWNDGMNQVGEHGQGESVWLGFFLYHVLLEFADMAQHQGDHSFVSLCQEQARILRDNLNQHGWDGAWYRRAYFDDGTPLGSAENSECQIDSIAQSWSVLSGAGDPQRKQAAMQSLDQRLVRREHGLIQLLDPPFDKAPMNPGYIKGYVPGVRENGGQYTHAAIWATMAFATLGDNRRAWELASMINPVTRASTQTGITTYKVEPYVIAADIYAVTPHTGRGGWTWYTGSAGWMYRLFVESLLGLRLRQDQLHFDPCVPDEWTQYNLHYRYLDTTYHIVLRRRPNDGVMTVSVDGQVQPGLVIALKNDHQEHRVEIEFSRTNSNKLPGRGMVGDAGIEPATPAV